MGQAGAQREPSMEEILASIRRIIENNEPGADGIPGDAGEVFSQHDADDHAADENTHDADPAPEGPMTAANDAPVTQPVSLADVAARARSMPEADAEDAAISIESRQDVPGHAAEVMDAAAEELREALTSDEPVEAVAQAVVAAVKHTLEEPVAPQADPVEPSVSSGDRQTPVDEAVGGQLVSMQTGEKVAAAFGELDAAIAAGQRRSFDEIAEEMLRPMLTQWLDDNLPTLVERLVREEIERVSRGNRQ